MNYFLSWSRNHRPQRVIDLISLFKHDMVLSVRQNKCSSRPIIVVASTDPVLGVTCSPSQAFLLPVPAPSSSSGTVPPAPACCARPCVRPLGCRSPWARQLWCSAQRPAAGGGALTGPGAVGAASLRTCGIRIGWLVDWLWTTLSILGHLPETYHVLMKIDWLIGFYTMN